MNFWIILLIFYSVMSGVTILAFAVDKMAAQRNSRRISERTLHLLEFSLGWPGALIALHLVRHKRQKSSYTNILYIISAFHILLVAMIFALK